MRILVTGGTGTVGEAVVTELVRRAHQVRLLSRNADGDAREWPAGVEPWEGNVTEPGAIRGSADGCDAVLHLVGIVSESPPERTFQGVNVDGTRHVLAEAARAGVPRLVYVSSLGADTGESSYHRSKAEAEELVRRYEGSWTICRVGNVYGPGDEVISLLLRWVRTLPAVPVVDDGDQPFQPVWTEDVAQGLAVCLERDDLAGRVLALTGAERTCMNDIVERFGELTDRRPPRLPVPRLLAAAGIRAAELLGIDLPVDTGQLTMLREGSVIERPEDNHLVSVLGVRPTPLAEGLARLADLQPEQLPEEGIGSLERKRFRVHIEHSRLSPAELMLHLRTHFADLTPWTMNLDAEPGTPRSIEEGATLTMQLPVRGRIQVRVQSVTDHEIVLVTLKGHPLAGAVRLRSEQRGELVRFEIEVHDRPADILDWLVMHPIGARMQNATWKSLLERMVDASGGRLRGEIEQESERLDEREAEQVQAWVEEVVRERKREERGG